MCTFLTFSDQQCDTDDAQSDQRCSQPLLIEQGGLFPSLRCTTVSNGEEHAGNSNDGKCRMSNCQLCNMVV